MSAINFVDYFYRKINGVKRVQFDAYLERTSGEGTYLFANGLPIGMAKPGDCQGIKMEFDYGVTPTLTTGKMAHGLDIKMTMDQDWDTDTKPYNCTVRGARIQAWSEDNISGRLTGAYINARAEGTDKEIEGYISGATGPGIIGIQARTELGTSATITSPAAVGVLIYHYSKAGSTLTGGYRGLQIEVPLMGSASTISSTTYGIYVGEDWGGGDDFDYGIYIASGTCIQPWYSSSTSTASGSAFYLSHTSSVTSGNIYGLRLSISGTGVSTGAIRGIRAEAEMGASAEASLLEAGLFNAKVSEGGVDVTECHVLTAQFSSGATAVVDELHVMNVLAATRGDETISGDDVLLHLENEAVGGNGRKMDSWIQCVPTNLSGVNGADYLIDGGTGTTLLGTAVFRLPDDGTICHSTGMSASSGLDNFDDFSGYITITIGTQVTHLLTLDTIPS